MLSIIGKDTDMKTFTYAIGDIHGRLDILQCAIDLIELHRYENDANAIVVFLGDYVDRGRESRKVCNLLMAGPKTENTKWVTIQGNHEVMCLEAHSGGKSEMDFWTRNGGMETYHSFGGRLPLSYLQWMASLPKYYHDGKRVFVHAGIKNGVPFDHQPEAVIQWIRYPDNCEIESDKGYVVHGHTPIFNGPLILNTRCDLDVGGYKTGRVCVAVFDNDIEGKPIELLEYSLGFDADV